MLSSPLPSKKTFAFLFGFLAVILMILPFATAFNEALTKIVEESSFYYAIQNIFVPYISAIVIGILNKLPGLEISSFPWGVVVNGIDVRITWNCLGWQSLILFIASLIVGIRGRYSSFSIFQAFLFGLAGTFLINIFRIVFTAALAAYWHGLFVILFHNYFSALLTIAWLFFFWYFVYNFVLEPRIETR